MVSSSRLLLSVKAPRSRLWLTSAILTSFAVGFHFLQPFFEHWARWIVRFVISFAVATMRVLCAHRSVEGRRLVARLPASFAAQALDAVVLVVPKLGASPAAAFSSVFILHDFICASQTEEIFERIGLCQLDQSLSGWNFYFDLARR